MEQLVVVSGRTLLKIAKIKGSVGLKGDIKIVPLFFTVKEFGELFSVACNDLFLFSDNTFPKKITVKEVKQKDFFDLE